MRYWPTFKKQARQTPVNMPASSSGPSQLPPQAAALQESVPPVEVKLALRRQRQMKRSAAGTAGHQRAVVTPKAVMSRRNDAIATPPQASVTNTTASTHTTASMTNLQSYVGVTGKLSETAVKDLREKGYSVGEAFASDSKRKQDSQETRVGLNRLFIDASRGYSKNVCLTYNRAVLKGFNSVGRQHSS